MMIAVTLITLKIWKSIPLFPEARRSCDIAVNCIIYHVWVYNVVSVRLLYCCVNPFILPFRLHSERLFVGTHLWITVTVLFSIVNYISCFLY